jgi:RNA polymerase sigma-70 factor (ECF subfamily)
VGSSEAQLLTDELTRERRGLLAHSYRMLGSWDDAEDAVQETLLRALRGWSGFGHRSSARVWLYRIATNVCLTALEQRHRRALPSGLGPPALTATEPPVVAEPSTWVQPILTAAVLDPESVAVSRESVRLAFIAGLQYLPRQQRAVLLLREVMAFSAAEVADMLDTSVAAVKSSLQRARARLDEVAPSRDTALAEPSEPRSQELLALYMAAWESSDAAAFSRLLRADATLEGVPSRTWFAGKETCLAFSVPFMGPPGSWTMVATSANGQPAAATWGHGEPYGLAVLTPAEDGIAALTLFADPTPVARFMTQPSRVG